MVGRKADLLDDIVDVGEGGGRYDDVDDDDFMWWILKKIFYCFFFASVDTQALIFFDSCASMEARFCVSNLGIPGVLLVKTGKNLLIIRRLENIFFFYHFFFVIFL